MKRVRQSPWLDGETLAKPVTGKQNAEEDHYERPVTASLTTKTEFLSTDLMVQRMIPSTMRVFLGLETLVDQLLSLMKATLESQELTLEEIAVAMVA